MKGHPYLEKLKQHGIVLGLERIYNALSEIGNPHINQKGVLIAGTNGKGSTAYILYNLLLAHNKKVALYTSPQIKEINDRYLINGDYITDERLGFYIEGLKGLSDKYNLTLFEFETLIAFKYFSDMNVDFSVYEVGMGGRLDATNCFNPKIKIITSISKDHLEYLGNSEEEILIEKAGIIKNNNIVITGIKNLSHQRWLEGYCKSKNSELKIFDRDFNYEDNREEKDYEIFNYRYKEYSFKDIYLSLYGRHQITNCALALTAFLELMNIYRLNIESQKVYQVLKNIHFGGRFEIYSKNPLIIIDGAHNIDGIEKLKISVKNYNIQNKKVLTIFSTLSNKEPFQKILLLKEISDRFIFVENSHPLTLKKDEFILLAQRLNLSYFDVMDIPAAINKIFNEYNEYLTLITGSLYTLESVYEELSKYHNYGQ